MIPEVESLQERNEDWHSRGSALIARTHEIRVRRAPYFEDAPPLFLCRALFFR